MFFFSWATNTYICIYKTEEALARMQDCITGLKDKLNDKLSKQRSSDSAMKSEMVKAQDQIHKLRQQNEDLSLKLNNEVETNKQCNAKIMDLESQLKKSVEKCNDLQMAIADQGSQLIKERKESEMKLNKELSNISLLDDITVNLRHQLQDLTNSLQGAENKFQKQFQFSCNLENELKLKEDSISKLNVVVKELEQNKFTLSSHLSEATGAISKLKVCGVLCRVALCIMYYLIFLNFIYMFVQTHIYCDFVYSYFHTYTPSDLHLHIYIYIYLEHARKRARRSNCTGRVKYSPGESFE
jgi:chromosome segregation ATPase